MLARDFQSMVSYPAERQRYRDAPFGLRSAWRCWRLSSGFDIAALVLIAAVAATAMLTVGDYGISNDEGVQHRYGELIIAYYASGFADREVFNFQNLYLYGGLFDVVAVLLGKVLPIDVYLLRHILCALTGIGGIAATWATARLVAGPRAGFFAALALATTAQWYGAMFNHTKDIPFAAAVMAATYFLLRAARDLPQPRWRDTLGFGLCFGAACGLRALGLLLLGYLATVGLIHLVRIRSDGWDRTATFAGHSAVRFLPGLMLGYALMLLVWPWAALAPLNPLRAIVAFGDFHYNIKTIFAGVIYRMAEVPPWYVIAYLLIRLPLPLLFAAALTGLLATRANFGTLEKSSHMRREIGVLWFTALFPVMCEVVASGPAFTGMRHFFFVVPPLAALAGIGVHGAIAWLAERGRVFAHGFAALLTAAFVWEASMMVRLHPYEYLYYNALVGGLPGAAGRYAMDYWVNIMPEAVRRLQAYLARDARAQRDRRYTVGVCGERFSFEHDAGPRLQWTSRWYEADFFIAPTHMNCDLVTNGKIIVRIERVGVLVGVVKDRRGFDPPNMVAP